MKIFAVAVAVATGLALALLTPPTRAEAPRPQVAEEVVAPAQPDQSVDSGLARELAASRTENSRMRRELDSVRKEFDSWKALNSRTIELKAANDRLTSEVEAARVEAQLLKGENEKAASKRNLYWFFSGAAVLAFGLLLGLALGGGKRRGNQSGYRF